MNRVAAACAECKATEDIASKVLRGCDEWAQSQPPAAMATKDEREIDKQQRAARRHIRKTQFAGIGVWGWLQIMGVVLQLIRWWWSRSAAAMNDRAE